MFARFNFGLLVAVYGASLLLISWRHLKSIRDGGDRFLQGEWLINYSDGLVRRGASGEVFLAASDATGLNIIVLLGVVQWGLLCVLLIALLVLAYQRGAYDRLTLFMLSPALVLFWFNDSYAPFRKELLAYLAFVPLLVVRHGEISNLRLCLSLSIFAVSVAAFEVNVAFAVPLGILCHLKLDKRRAWYFTVAIAAITLLSISFSLTHSSVEMTDNMCARVVAAGASPQVCDGLMLWMQKGFVETVQAGWHEVGLHGGTRNFVLGTVMFIVIFGLPIFLYRELVFDSLPLLALCASFSAFVPFYFLGSDWGRWMSAQMFVGLFLILALTQKSDRAQLQEPLNRFVYWPVLAVNLLIGIYHMVPYPIPGFIFVVIRSARNLLT